MEELKPKLIEYAIGYWMETLTGLSSLDAAQHFGVSHNTVLDAFDELERESVGSVRRNVEVYPVSIDGSLDGMSVKVEPEPVVTSVFFPAREVLAKWFYANVSREVNVPIYKTRLCLGESQTLCVYFSLEVLSKYFNHIEFFDVDDSVVGGYIFLKQGEGDFPLLRFGKRQLVDGSVVVAVLLWDLAQLPEREQEYWHSCEIEIAPSQFATDDPDFLSFYRQSFEAEFIDSNDPLQGVLAEIDRINRILREELFSGRRNPYLHYPSINTYRGFVDSCSELYKLIGPDSLKRQVLQNILTTYFNYQSQDFVHPDTDRPRGQLDLLGKLCMELGCDKLPHVIREIKRYRVDADHRIIYPESTAEYYPAKFRSLLQNLQDALQEFGVRLESLVKVDRDME